MAGDYYDYDPDDAYDDELVPVAQAPLSPYRAYLEDSAMPLTAFIFTLPLFAAYHAGVWYVKSRDGQGWANAAEVTIAWALGRLHWAGPLLAFVAVGVTFLVLQQRENVPWRRPPLSTFALMAGESALFALPVVILNQIVHFLRHDFDRVRLAADGWAGVGADGADAGLTTVAQVALSCGAGVYEEFLFRLVAMGFLAWGLKALFGLRGGALYFVSAAAQALLFSAFHHLPGSEDPFETGKFAFRTLAGMYFAYLYWERGYGIAAGAHAAYDLFTVAAQR